MVEIAGMQSNRSSEEWLMQLKKKLFNELPRKLAFIHVTEETLKMQLN